MLPQLRIREGEGGGGREGGGEAGVGGRAGRAEESRRAGGQQRRALHSPCGDSVGGADDAGVEHDGAPELAGHKGGQGEANDHAAGNEAGGVGDGGHAKGGSRAEELQHAVAVAGTVGVADCRVGVGGRGGMQVGE